METKTSITLDIVGMIKSLPSLHALAQKCITKQYPAASILGLKVLVRSLPDRVYPWTHEGIERLLPMINWQLMLEELSDK